MSPAAPIPTIPTLADLPLVISTPRLRMRPIEQGDVEAIWPVVSDPAFPVQMSWNAHTDKAQTRAFVAIVSEALEKGEGITWAIEREGSVQGVIGFDDITWQLRAWRVDRAELGYWIAPALQGQGLMTEAAHAVVRWGFETLGLHKINVGCFADNAASRRVIEKVGFRYVGRLEDDVWRDGRWWSGLRFELTAPEWPDVQTTMRVSRPRRS